jgi:hypothetical protein
MPMRVQRIGERAGQVQRADMGANAHGCVDVERYRYDAASSGV